MMEQERRTNTLTEGDIEHIVKAIQCQCTTFNEQERNDLKESVEFYKEYGEIMKESAQFYKHYNDIMAESGKTARNTIIVFLITGTLSLIIWGSVTLTKMKQALLP
jgi:uncharacterized Rmd1/YagE family protein